MPTNTVKVNRAPVLTLWAAVVAARRGYDWPEALTLGKAVAGLTAQSKGRRLGIYAAKTDADGRPARKRGLGEEFFITLCGRSVPAKNTKDGVRAVAGDKPEDPANVERYLSKAFGKDYEAVLEAMRDLARAFKADELESVAFSLYERFRPPVAHGVKGWGQKGELDVERIRSLGSRNSR